MPSRCHNAYPLLFGSSLPLVALLTFGSSPTLSAPMTFNTALPVAEGEFVTRLQGIRTESGDDPSPADRDVIYEKFALVADT